MCYSAKLKQEYLDLIRRYRCQLDWDEFVELVRQRERGAQLDIDLKIPDGLVAGLIELGGSAAKEIELIQRRWKVAERKRLEADSADAEIELKEAEHKLAAKATKTNQKAVETKQRKVERARRAIESASVAVAGDYRIYPFYFAPIILEACGQRKIVPARYRILPRTGVEVPPAYNVFNARRDSLQSARNWKPLFGKQHALFPFQRFYEWVESGSGKVEISFNPDGHDGMHAAALFEEYQHPELGCIRSFAMVTDDPPPEVAAAGHDRCPVFLENGLIDNWLAPSGQSLEVLDALLGEKERAYYSHSIAA